MNYSDALKYLQSFINYERMANFFYKDSFKLERVKSFLEIIGDPQDALRCIHIAGSKGKGSVCAFIAYILKEAGFKVGLYTSPHLSDFRERIRILAHSSELIAHSKKFTPKSHELRAKSSDFEGMISQKEICDLVKKLKPKIEEFNKNSEYGDLTHSTLLRVNPEFIEGLTFFEIYTALAFDYFKEKKTDFVVLETGLGGRLDATNTCNSLISVITPLSLEHTYLLGKTLKEIAFEKAAIIKKENKISVNGKRIVLSAEQEKESLKVIDKRAKENNALLFKEGKDFKFSLNGDSSFNYQGLNYDIKNLKINLLGSHQIANASLAIAAIEALRYHNISVSKEVIRKGLERCVWPSRLEVVSSKPVVILDGAHNSASVKVLHKAVNENFGDKEIWLIFGISQDKELKATCREIEKFGARIILTKSNNPRAAEPQHLLKYFSANSMILTNTTKDALNIAQANAKKQDLILVTGSLFVCGEAREQVMKERGK